MVDGEDENSFTVRIRIQMIRELDGRQSVNGSSERDVGGGRAHREHLDAKPAELCIWSRRTKTGWSYITWCSRSKKRPGPVVTVELEPDDRATRHDYVIECAHKGGPRDESMDRRIDPLDRGPGVVGRDGDSGEVARRSWSPGRRHDGGEALRGVRFRNASSADGYELAPGGRRRLAR